MSGLGEQGCSGTTEQKRAGKVKEKERREKWVRLERSGSEFRGGDSSRHLWVFWVWCDPEFCGKKDDVCVLMCVIERTEFVSRKRNL